MKKIVLLILFAASISGCAATGMNGWLYTGVTEPVNATNAAQGSQTGEASCINVLGIVAAGNCSIDEAARQGGIKAIKTVDKKRSSVLGLYVKETTIVTGE